jgi:hypothetical protein
MIEADLRADVEKAFFGYSIPALWSASKTHAFVIDFGYGCYEYKLHEKYLDDKTLEATGACVDGKSTT